MLCASLAEAGAKVLLIDRDEPGQGASSGNAVSSRPVTGATICTRTMAKIPKWLLKSNGPIAIRPSYLFQLAPWVIRFLWQGRVERVREISDAMAVLNHNNVDMYRALLKTAGKKNSFATATMCTLSVS